jgi:LEA14-like dessication related protein
MTRAVPIRFSSLWLFIALLLNSCAAPQALEFKGLAGLKLTRDKEAHKLQLQVGLKLQNPNRYKVLLKRTRLDVYINQVRIGEARGRFAKQKIQGGKEGIFELTITTERDQMLKAAVGSIGRILLGNPSVKFKVDGYVKGGIFMLGKKFPITLEKEIDLNFKDVE